MKVPDELVEEALEAGCRPADGEIGLLSDSRSSKREGMRRALEAVLPKVRARLMENAEIGARAFWEAVGPPQRWEQLPDGLCDRYVREALEILEPSFDHAFPPDEEARQ